MKRIIATSLIVVGSLMTMAQSWNPYVNQGIVEPAPLLPAEFGGTGVFSFNLGNSGSTPMPLVANDEMKVIITLSDALPANANPIAALGGSWVSRFNWTWEPGANALHGVQNQTIPGMSDGNITVDFEVLNNSTPMALSNGFQVQLIVPAYCGAKNHTQDDKVSSYTYVKARDYGDAPPSYGVAAHDINIFKNNGQFNRYLYLGTVVDADADNLQSPDANGDDADGLDDEDGVQMPVLAQGSQVSIPVFVTVHDNSFGFLMAWIDWNGDGDFADNGELITAAPVYVSNTGTQYINVTVPLNAHISGPTYARFRVGAPGSPIGVNSWGEVEDYEIQILGPQPGYSLSMTKVGGPSTITQAGQQLNYEVVLTNTAIPAIHNVMATKQFPGNGVSVLSQPVESMTADNVLQPGESWTYSAIYTATQADINNFASILNEVIFTSAEIPQTEVVGVSTPIMRNPALTVDVVASPNVNLRVGDVVTLTHTVSNAGNVSMGNVGMSVTHSGYGNTGNVTPNFVSSILPNGSATFTSTYVVSASDAIAQQAISFTGTVFGLFNAAAYTASDIDQASMKANDQIVSVLVFDASLLGSDVKVEWSTAYEINNALFRVMRRHQYEQNYVQVGVVQGAGNSAALNSYSFVDDINALPPGWINYKLDVSTLTDSVNTKTTGFDDGNDGEFGINVYPMPPVDALNIEIYGQNSQTVDISLINSLGQRVAYITGYANSLLQLDFKSLAPGAYYLEVWAGDKTLTRKVVKP